jgi:hypothetical protein
MTLPLKLRLVVLGHAAGSVTSHYMHHLGSV